MKKSKGQIRNFCFTINNWTDKDISRLAYLTTPKSQVKAKYLIYGKEVGEQGTPHLQGYCELSSKISFSVLKEHIPNAHIESRIGTAQQALEYCKKEDEDPFIFGKLSRQGQRTDIEELYAFIRDEAISLRQIREEFPTQYIIYNKVIHQVFNDIQQEKLQVELLEEEYSSVGWRPWQQAIFKRLREKPDRRTVIWRWESNGNVGKSFLARYLLLKEKAYYVTGGRKADIFHAYNKEPIVIFDLPRGLDSEEGKYIYEVIECFKNGQFLSTKYNTQIKLFRTPHVLVFANFQPALDAPLSLDRWDIKKI